MTLVELVFFGTHSDSTGGLQRSIVSFLIFFAISWFWFGTAVGKHNIVTRLASSLSLALVVASAIGVLIPNTTTTTYDVVLYSTLVGATISVSIASTLVMWGGSSIPYAISMVILSMLTCGSVGWANLHWFSKLDFKK